MINSKVDAVRDPRGAALERLSTMVESMRTLVSVARIPSVDAERDVNHDELKARLAAENFHASAGELLAIFRQFRFDVSY